MSEQQAQELLVTFLQPAILLTIAGGIVSLITSYVYGFREWYAALKPEQKGLGQVLIVTVMILFMALLSWTHFIQVVPADKMGAITLAASWIGAIVLNQTTYALSKPVASVLLIKEASRKEGLAEAKVEVKEGAAAKEATDVL